ncbi:MAG: hypothetical protein VW079_01815 [Candidatus Woesearchaeota archaeon]
MKTYTDKNGYIRYKYTRKLVHRTIYKKIYDNSEFKFSECLVYHKDRNKNNNKLDNLKLITPADIIHFRESLNCTYKDSRDVIIQKYAKKYKRDNYLNLCFLEGILRKSKLPIILNENSVSRLKNELNFERKFMKQ